MIWKLTKDSKRHIAGPMIDGGIQRCARCHAAMTNGEYLTCWREGTEVISNRSGAGLAEGYSNASDIRLCGRKTDAKG